MSGEKVVQRLVREYGAESYRHTRKEAANGVFVLADKRGYNIAASPHLHDVLCNALDQYSWYMDDQDV